MFPVGGVFTIAETSRSATLGPCILVKSKCNGTRSSLTKSIRDNLFTISWLVS